MAPQAAGRSGFSRVSWPRPHRRPRGRCRRCLDGCGPAPEVLPCAPSQLWPQLPVAPLCVGALPCPPREAGAVWGRWVAHTFIRVAVTWFVMKGRTTWASWTQAVIPTCPGDGPRSASVGLCFRAQSQARCCWCPAGPGLIGVRQGVRRCPIQGDTLTQLRCDMELGPWPCAVSWCSDPCASRSCWRPAVTSSQQGKGRDWPRVGFHHSAPAPEGDGSASAARPCWPP